MQPNFTTNALPIATFSDVTAEEKVLGSLLIDPGLIADIRQTIGPSDFHDYRLRLLFQNMLDMFDADREIDSGLVARFLKERGLLDNFDNGAYLLHIEAMVELGVTTRTISGWADHIKKLSMRRLITSESSQAMLAIDRRDPLDVLDDLASRMLPIRTRLAPPVATEKPPNVSDVPALPEYACIDYSPASGAGAFVDDYLRYALTKLPMTPANFHTGLALWLGSVAIARRLQLVTPRGPVYPNLWVALVAPPGQNFKTLAVDEALRLARRTFPHLLAPKDSTPESLFAAMAGQEPANLLQLPLSDQDLWKARRDFSAQRCVAYDEVTGLLSNASKDYNAALIDALLKLYDCEERAEQERKGQGLLIVKNSYLCMAGATTPQGLARFMVNDPLSGKGWWARWTLLFTDKKVDYEPSAWAEEPQALLKTLDSLYNRLPKPQYPQPPQAHTVILGDGVLEAWQSYDKAVYGLNTDALDERLRHIYTRFSLHLLKVATILASFDWANETEPTQTPTVTVAHVGRALQIVEDWRQSAHKLLAAVSLSVGGKFLAHLKGMLSAYGERGATVRELYVPTGKTPFEILNFLQQLQASGEVEAWEQRGAKGGRPTTRYRVVK